MTNALPETVDGLPNISGSEDSIREAIASAAGRPVYPPDNGVDFGRIRSTFAVALHMHQPLIPAGGDDLRSAGIISNLAWMMDASATIGDSHNAPVFAWCYKRMGEFIPQLLGEGRQPRVMLDYSGTLLHGCGRWAWRRVRRARHLTRDPGPPDTRVARLHLGPRGGAIDAGAGLPAARARLAAPLRRHLRPGGARRGSGDSPRRDGAAQPARCRLRVRPHAARLRLSSGCWSRNTPWNSPTAAAWSARICRTGWSAQTPAATRPASSRSSRPRAATPSSWGRCSPTTRPRASRPLEIAGRSVPPLVTQIADGENGGVMMNEFPPK